MPDNATPFWRLCVLLPMVILLVSCGSAPPKVEDKGPIVFPKPPDPPRFVFEQTILGTGSIRDLDEKDRLKALLTGSVTREGVGFAKPFDVAVKHGRIHVTDTVQRLVIVLDFPNQTGFQIGDRGDDGDLLKPLGVAADDAGNIYVVDATAYRLQIYNSEGDFQRFLNLRGLLKRPAGVDVTPDGSRVFLVDTGGIDSEQHQVLVLDAISGNLIKAIGTRGIEDGEMNLPRDVSLGKDGLLYVTDGGNFRVQAFTQNGEFVRTWGKPGRRVGQFSRPKGIAVDSQGNVYVADAAFGNFQIFNPEGKLLMFIGDRSTTPQPAKYMLPAGIDVDEDGRIYFVDQFFRKLDVFRPVRLKETDGWLGTRPAESK